MKFLKKITLLLVVTLSISSCFKDNDDVISLINFNDPNDLEIEDFVWKAMNAFYLYKPDNPDLANDRFATQGEYEEYLRTFENADDLFFNGLVTSFDRFSFRTLDYRELENSFAGISKSNGMEFGLVRLSENSSQVFGYVRYVIPNSPAAAAGLQRGVIFNRIDDVELTDTNFRELIAPDTYTIGLATLSNATLTPLNDTVSLTKVELTENPVHIAKTLTVNSQKIGYVLYNSFVGNFDEQLNNAFGQLRADGVTDLILDLRYNGGGSVESAIDLASMITGQFNGQLFSTEQWNPDIQAILEENNPDRLTNYFNNTIRTGAAINSLNLGRIFIITSSRSASASELVISGLDPYINVMTIGDTTTGKFQASITLYDSSDFGRQGVNPRHFYALQPLVLTSANADGVTGFIDGLTPDVEIREDFENLGILGEETEPLLAAAIDQIVSRRSNVIYNTQKREQLGDAKMNNLLDQEMYKEYDFSINRKDF
ncbi:S41 family peptidase [Aquimarina rhabdastrellae]